MPKNHSIGIVDLRSLGYYDVQHQVLQYNLSQSYQFEYFGYLTELNADLNLNFLGHSPCGQINLLNKIKITDSEGFPHKIIKNHNARSRSGLGSNPFPWLDDVDPRKFMSDQKILDTTINLSKSN